MTAVGVTVILKVKEGKEQEFEKVFAQLAAQVQANEPGIIFYEVMRVTDDSRSYVVMEKYKNEEARVTHSKSAHFIEAQPLIGPLLDGRPIVHRLVSL